MPDVSVNPLFYQSVTPLDSQRHKSLRLGQPDKPFGYAALSNLIPAVVDEFELASPELCIAFLPTPAGVSAVFVTGTAPGHNCFVSDAGNWMGGYVPAYLRRYPFIIGDIAGSESVLCFDESYGGFADAKGQPLFQADGSRTEALAKALAFSQTYRDAAKRTESFCRMLSDFALLQAATLDITGADGSRSTVHGIEIVDEAALAALPGDRLVQLNAAGFLRAIYAQITSLRAISRLTVPASFAPALEEATP